VHTPMGHAALAATGLPSRASLGSASEPSELPGTAGVFQVERGVAVLLDLDALLTNDRLEGLASHAAPRPVGVA